MTFNNLIANGKISMLGQFGTYRNRGLASGSDSEVSPERRDKILSRTVTEILMYRDSVAAVVTTFPGSRDSTMRIIGWVTLENGEWRNAGEDLGTGDEGTRNRIISKAPLFLEFVHRIEQLQQIPSNTQPLTDYLSQNGMPPKEYLLDKLSNRKVVVIGELHRRKNSWDMMQELIADPRFAKQTGYVFMELPSYKQSDMDRFFENKEIHHKTLLDIFRSEQVYGWYDKDEYNFLISLWKLNKKLPAKDRIRVILADYQVCWDSIRTKQQWNNQIFKDRNTHMADIIENTISTSKDKRNAMFIVGYSHAMKSNIDGIASSSTGQQAAPPAGNQLKARLGKDNVSTLFPHLMTIHNNGRVFGNLRQGIFDSIFAQAGDRPVAFDLIADKPFGQEPFDGGIEQMFLEKTGSYANCFDGYLFFGPLKQDLKSDYLYEIFDDEFVAEMKRRAEIIGTRQGERWYGIEIPNLTKEGIIRTLTDDHQKELYW